MTTAAPTRVLEALRYRRFLISSWPWRALAYVLPTLIISGMIWLVLGCLLSPWIATGVAVQNGRHLGLWPAVLAGVIGLILVAFFGSPIAVGLARVERRRMRLIDSRPIRSGHTGSGFWSLYTDSATWREFAYLVLVGVTVPIWGAVFSIAGVGIGALLVTPLVAASHGSRAGDALASAPNSPSLGQATALAVLGLLLLPVFAYGTAVLAGAHAALTRALLHTEPDTTRTELVAVERSRARLVDAFDAERRRIERDLHDGAQQRLVSLGMHLGLAAMDLNRATAEGRAETPSVSGGRPEPDPGADALGSATAAVAAAQLEAKALMVELRELIHGINPRTLTEFGLTAALPELAERSVVPVEVRTSIPQRPPEQIESVAYFAVSEALTNIAKHSGATRGVVTATAAYGELVIEVYDDGRGGANPTGGTGLAGLADRVAAAGGRLLLSSPAGGPTRVRLELPCP